jgi:hypothetical protein
MSGEFCAKKVTRAAKAYRCHECYRVIDKGESVTRYAGSWEGDFWKQDTPTCAHCVVLQEALREFTDPYEFGPLSDELADSDLWDLTNVTVVQLLRGRVWFDRRWRDKSGALVPVPVVSS